MIQPTAILDPRGRPTNGRMPFIGGPLCGRDWSAFDTLHINDMLRQQHGGQYEYADTNPWSYIWVPKEP